MTDLGLLSSARIRRRVLDADLPIEIRLADSTDLVEHSVGGEFRRFNQPCTFTPFASARPCSARCRFCSETLAHRNATTLSASLRPGPDYGQQLRRALAALRAVRLGFSLSGLEASDDFDWVTDVIAAATEHEAAGGAWEGKVMYSNANGFHPDGYGTALVDRLVAFGLDRVEISRHATDAEKNDAIMRFRPGTRVQDNAEFARAVDTASERLTVRLVCVLQQGGVATLDEALAYVAFAKGLGVTDVVFRELSRLGDDYRHNASWRYVESHRAPLDSLLDEWWPANAAPRAGFVPRGAVAGYYYYNLHGDLDGVRITLETSDYTEMKGRHQSDVIHKLVFHANGNLCADWDPNTRVLLRA